MKELIQKYFDAQTSLEEKKKIEKYFRKNPDKLSFYFSEEDWEEEINTSSSQQIASQDVEALIGNVFAYSAQRRRIRMYQTVAAAAVFLVITASLFFYSSSQKNDSVNSVTATADSVKGQSRQWSNTTSEIMKFYLPDSSRIELYPNSSVEYAENLDNHTRNVTLKGNADFKVYKDASRKFTVYCGSTTTTALGTEFLIRSNDTNNLKQVAVSLIEGKILVKNADDLNGKDYYLLPGNKIIFDPFSKTFTLIDNLNNNNNPASSASLATADLNNSNKINAVIAKPVIEEKQNGDVQFMNVPLSDVLNKLAESHGVKISYPTARIKKIIFAGTLQQSKPIDKILSDIAVMNDLELSKDSVNQTYILH